MVSEKNRLVLYFLISYLGFGIFQPLFPVYLQKELGFDGGETSFLVSFLSLITFFGVPLWGIICDRMGRLNQILCLTSLGTAGSVLLLLSVDSFLTVLGVVILMSFLQCSLVLISDSIALSFSKRTGHVYRKIRSWATFGATLSPFVIVGLGTLLTRIICLYVSIILISALIAYYLPQDREPNETVSREELKELFSSKKMVFSWMTVIFLIGTIQSFPGLIGVLYPSSVMMGVLSGIMQLSTFLSMQISQKWLDWKGSILLIIIAFLSAARWGLIFFFPSDVTFIIAALIQGAGAGILLTIMMEKMNPTGKVSINVSVFYTVLSFCIFVWTFLNGVFSDLFGMFAGAAFLGIISLLGVLFFLSTLQTKE